MPELPEVQRARRELEACALGRKLVLADAVEDNIVYVGDAQAKVKHALEGRVLKEVVRKGKNLCLVTDGGPWQVAFHFGMTGAFRIAGKESISYQSLRKGSKRADSDKEESLEWPPRFSKLLLEVEDGTRIAFVDPRRLGRVRIFPDRSEQKFWTDLGPDAHDELPSSEELVGMLRGRRAAAVKSVILDQTFLSGIGNWIADEVLYQSRLHPERKVESLSDVEISCLRDTIQAVLDLAVAADADSSKYPTDWLFHYRWSKKKESKTSDGKLIKFVTVGSRTSAYVPQVQKMRKTKPVDDDAQDFEEDNSDAHAEKEVEDEKPAPKSTRKRGRSKTSTKTKTEEVETKSTKKGRQPTTPSRNSKAKKEEVQESLDPEDGAVRRSTRKRGTVNYRADGLQDEIDEGSESFQDSSSDEDSEEEAVSAEKVVARPRTTRAKSKSLSASGSGSDDEEDFVIRRRATQRVAQSSKSKGKAPSDETVARVEQVFSILDRNANGLLTVEDILHASDEYGMNFFLEDVAPMVSRFAAKGGQSLTKQDLLAIAVEVGL